MKKFWSLNAVDVRVADRTDKLLIVRDSTHMVWLKELEKAKRDMCEFTQNMMNLIDDYASNTTNQLKEVQQLVGGNAHHARKVKECLLDMRRTRYSVRDFMHVYDIAENNFEEPIYRRLDLRASIAESVEASYNDLLKSHIELRTEIHDSLPQYIAVEENFFH